eukprot:TRINITY_DN4_c7_g1_i1.p1 TRINITY_DN4_c7_g1~~TRINITY_DN4_c7_g1_i1.p1  ORF type:complete len:73 (+),score=4.78 TRINITY_DN4_c7_g1_i1:75-293(+)
MKLSSKVVGCVKETAFVRSDGNLLFASGNEIIITGGENGDQLLFTKDTGWQYFFNVSVGIRATSRCWIRNWN